MDSDVNQSPQVLLSEHAWSELQRLKPNSPATVADVITRLEALKGSPPFAQLLADLATSLSTFLVAPTHNLEGKPRAQAKVAENCLSVLRVLCAEQAEVVRPETLVSVTGHVYSTQPWATPLSRSCAGEILATCFCRSSSLDDFIVHDVLQGFLRRSLTVSDSLSNCSTGYISQRCPYALEVYTWTVRSASPELVNQHWSLFIPPLSAFLCDTDDSTRVGGLEATLDFLSKCSWKVIRDVGLSKVLEDVVLPNLHLLPPITPEESSSMILNKTFDVCIKLATLDPNGVPNGQILDRILRDGILQPYESTRQHDAISILLLRQSTSVVSKLGFRAAKHLKHLLFLYASVLTDPHDHQTEKLLAAIDAIEATVVATWPVMTASTHAFDVMEMISICWIDMKKVSNLNSHVLDVRKIQEKLRHASSLLFATLQTSEGPQFDAEYIAKLKNEVPTLADLYDTTGENLEENGCSLV